VCNLSATRPQLLPISSPVDELHASSLIEQEKEIRNAGILQTEFILPNEKVGVVYYQIILSATQNHATASLLHQSISSSGD
jgi:hypothetical protein